MDNSVGHYSEEHRAAIRRALGTCEYPDDLTGLTFGRWTVISRAPDRRDTGLRGAHAELLALHLRRGTKRNL